MYYQLYPESNVAPSLQGTHDARGVSVSGTFRDFRVRLKKPVETDTYFKFGIDASLLNPDTDLAIPNRPFSSWRCIPNRAKSPRR